MPRVARGLTDGMVYHVINRGNCRQLVFHKDEDYKAFVCLMGEAKERHPVKLLGYCLMPNHFHLLLAPEKANDLSKFMQWLLTSHVRRYHSHYRTSGHVWQGRYKSFIVKQDKHILTVVRYIEGNPVRAKISPSAAGWRWSSHAERVSRCRGKLVDEIALELPPNWTEYVDTPLTDAELEKVQRSINRGAPFGDDDWLTNICNENGLGLTISPKGRPRKSERQ